MVPMITGFDIMAVFADFNLILKLFVLIMIISFVKSHLGGGPLATMVMVFIAFFVIFDAWKIFGGIYLLYAIITLGFSGLLIDFFFVTPPLANQRENPESDAGEGINSQDVKERINRLHMAGGRAGHHGGRPPGPPPMMG
ncbi:MAG: hypothetical protein J4215_02630 [Candidatus Diapherotrites archaeon]|uniref:Uncharacterized protein n=1 Tax=Candidatus Iainarchaeum sp. TaxID=3101447 RepID=A0A8T4LEZ0_9ARCH|nr:hypothetical protein [Candidatus Diapherotrites archaeon]